MRYQTLFLPLVSLAIVGACTDQPTSPTAPTDFATLSAAVTPATRTEFAGFIHFCESAPFENVRLTPGSTLHLDGARNQNLWVTGNPLVDGIAENVVGGMINLNNGTGVGHLEVAVTPEAVEGTWEIKSTVKIVGGAPGGSRGVGHGTGELDGMTIRYTAEPPVFGQNSCNPNMGSAPVQGVITSPATSD
ncbi:MAG: hypothetical protein ACRENI_03065 [Gemmatimonadaceae bacterium]